MELTKNSFLTVVPYGKTNGVCHSLVTLSEFIFKFLYTYHFRMTFRSDSNYKFKYTNTVKRSEDF